MQGAHRPINANAPGYDRVAFLYHPLHTFHINIHIHFHRIHLFPLFPPNYHLSTTMMLASPSYSQPMYTPTRPSPLSPRSSNVLSKPFSFTMAAPLHKNNTPVPQRAHKVNPVIQNRDAVAQRRREMFFRRVQKQRDDKKWDARGEQVC
jgi:hypothetical protein